MTAKSHHAGPHAHEHGKSCCGGAADAKTVVKDPVCGMTVDPHTAKHRLEHGGRTYYFCADRCRAKFAADPGRYLSTEVHDEPVNPGAIYTCPMHPEIRQVGP